MSKYILEIKPEYEDKFKGVMILGAENSNLYVDSNTVDELEELTADYINEHFGDLQDTAYKKGFEDGRMVGIKDGMCEAWEVARKIIHMPEGDLLNIFTECYSAVCTALQVLLKYDASEAIAKLKAYEEKESEEIKVGDIIANNTEPKLKVWVTHFDEIGFCGIAITDFGTVDKGELYASCSPKGWHKIGRFDINKILERVVL